MANKKSAEKRARQAVVRNERNHSRISRIRTFTRKVEEAIQKGEKTSALEVLKGAQPEIMRGVTKGVLHINTASRTLSRLAKRINNL